MRKLSISTWYEIENAMDQSDDMVKDVAREVLAELFNPAYVTDEERVTGILEAIELVTEVKTK